MVSSTFKIVILSASILFIILAAWSLHIYNKLSEVDQSKVEGLCGVTPDSIKNGKNFSLIMLVVAIAVFLVIVGQYAYEKTNIRERMRFAF